MKQRIGILYHLPYRMSLQYIGAVFFNENIQSIFTKKTPEAN